MVNLMIMTALLMSNGDITFKEYTYKFKDKYQCEAASKIYIEKINTMWAKKDSVIKINTNYECKESWY